jgi:hypothetical protein
MDFLIYCMIRGFVEIAKRAALFCARTVSGGLPAGHLVFAQRQEDLAKNE